MIALFMLIEIIVIITRQEVTHIVDSMSVVLRPHRIFFLKSFSEFGTNTSEEDIERFGKFMAVGEVELQLTKRNS